MVKHIHILSLVLSLTCLISSLINKDDLFTICGWFTATMTSFTSFLYFEIIKMGKDD